VPSRARGRGVCAGGWYAVVLQAWLIGPELRKVGDYIPFGSIA